MLGKIEIYNHGTNSYETYHINGGQVTRGKAQKTQIAGDVPWDQQSEICTAIFNLEKVLLNAQGWDGRMNKVHERS